MPATPSLPRSGADQHPVPVAHAAAKPDGNPRHCAESSLRPSRPGQPHNGQSTPGHVDSTSPARTKLPAKTVLLGVFGAGLLALGGIGAGGVLVRDPLLADSGLSWVRFGHGRDLASAVLYLGVGMIVWAWVRLGRGIRADRVNSRGVLAAIAAWTAPLLVAPPLFSRDTYSYLAQGALAYDGFDPYEVGPSALSRPVVENVSWVWQNTPAPYGPLFVLLAKGVVAITGDGLISGVVLMRLAMVPGLVLMCWALPGLARHLGGRAPIALWLVAANPLILVHLVGGPHNDLPMVGLLAAGVLLVLDRRHVAGIAVVTLGAAIKATAALALPFLVWVWAARLGTHNSARLRFVRAASGSLAVFIAVFAGCSLVAEVDLGWIGALSSSSAIVNWLSVPTAVGQFVHTLLHLFVDVGNGVFLAVARGLGFAALAVIVARQWWAARDGGPEAVRRAAIALVAVAALSPATLPWYFSWALALAAGLAWSGPALTLAVCGSVWLLLVTFPTGDTALYSWMYLGGALALSVLAAVSLVRADPIGLAQPGR